MFKQNVTGAHHHKRLPPRLFQAIPLNRHFLIIAEPRFRLHFHWVFSFWDRLYLGTVDLLISRYGDSYGTAYLSRMESHK